MGSLHLKSDLASVREELVFSNASVVETVSEKAWDRVQTLENGNRFKVQNNEKERKPNKKLSRHWLLKIRKTKLNR